MVLNPEWLNHSSEIVNDKMSVFEQHIAYKKKNF